MQIACLLDPHRRRVAALVRIRQVPIPQIRILVLRIRRVRSSRAAQQATRAAPSPARTRVIVEERPTAALRVTQARRGVGSAAR